MNTADGPDVAASGRPSNERDGACICDYNPDTTDGPQEDCPFHGRPYAYWVERGDTLADRLAAVTDQRDQYVGEIEHLLCKPCKHRVREHRERKQC